MNKNKIKNDEIDYAFKYKNINFVTKRLISNFYETIYEITKKIEVNKILEVGCGNGYSTEYLSDIFKDNILEASDCDLKLVNVAKNKIFNVNITQESIYKLNRESESFDLILALEVLEHLDSPEKALLELKRVTKKYCILSIPREPLWRFLNITRGYYLRDLGNTPGHINHWSKRKFIKFIEKYFKIIEIKTPTPWMIFLIEK